MSTADTTDPRGDVPPCNGDLLAARADWTEARLVLQVTAACDIDLSDPAWTQGGSNVAFYIDTDGDDRPDHAALYDARNHGDLFRGSDLACDGTATATGSSLTITLGPDCLPRPFRYSATMFYNEPPAGPSCICSTDKAPDSGFAGPVYRGDAPRARGKGYWMLDRDGNVYAFGDAAIYDRRRLPGHNVDIEPTPSGLGYWTLSASAGVMGHGDAEVFGTVDSSTLRPFEVQTAISRTPSGRGYWVFTNRGRVVPFGDAGHFGDMSGTALNGPVLDAIPTTSGRGYYMVGSDGGIFTFGDAVFGGSMGGTPLNAPVQSLVPDPDGVGYWLVASDGGIFAFDAEFYGSMGSTPLNRPITGMVGFGRGYLMVAEDGGIFTFGDAPFFGSLGDRPPPTPVTSTAILDH